MQLSDKAYTYLKWITMVLIPAATTLYVALSAIWGFPYASEVAKTSAACCAFLGAILGISTASYYKGDDLPYDDDDDKYWLDDDEMQEKTE